MKKIALFIVLLSLIMPAQSAKAERRVSFVAVGDNLIHSSVYKSAATGAGYDFSPVYAGVADVIENADVAFVNQETMLGEGNYSGYPRFCSPKEVGAALAGVGFDVINIANNHSLDLGEDGFLFTRDWLSSLAECVIGDGTVRIVERDGVKIAFLAFTYATNYGTSGVVSRIGENEIRRAMAEATAKADAVIVSVHWGVEYDTPKYIEKFEPTEAQTETARLFASLGADIIVGTHPHVVERAEWIEENGNRAFCAYSLGNFVSNMRYGGEQLGGMLSCDIVKRGSDVTVENPKILPIVCHYDAYHRGHAVFKLSDYTDELAAQHGTQNESSERKFSKKYLTEIYENNIAPEYRAKGF